MTEVYKRLGFAPADILLPEAVDMRLWSVVACDQFTSQPDYWADVEKRVGAEPSALRLMLPEVFLGADDVEARIEAVNANMRRYLERGVFKQLTDAFVYVERTLKNGRVRRGLVGAVDLESYDFHSGARSLIRATEGTVLERIPPRVRVRENAPLEMPHVMLLIDDPGRTVIEPLAAGKKTLRKLYDFELMEGGGKVAGYAVTGEDCGPIARALGSLCSPETFSEKYGVEGSVMAYAVGDGNHSLATAKTCWEQIRAGLSAQERENHPARFALVELVNVHDDSLVFEPIHRAVFGVEPQKLIGAFLRFYPGAKRGEGSGHRIDYVCGGEEGVLTCMCPEQPLAVGMLQAFLDDYTAREGGKVDYIHGDDVARRLGKQKNAVSFLLPAMGKSELFSAVIRGGALPRKTFSMGEACDKRYYLECRAIR